MMPTLVAIAVLHWAVLILPGFNFLLIGQLAASGRRSTAMAAVAGMTTATLMWALLAVAGVGIVFTAHPVIRQVAQVAGGIYLLVLAVRLWRSGQAPDAASSAFLPPVAALRAGFVTSALNPKIALFYGSVFATAFPADPSSTLVVLAVAMVYLNSVVWHTGLALALSAPFVQRAWMSHFRTLNRLAGTLVGGMGLKLLAGTLMEWRDGGA